jgi:hypothetical protein
LTRYNETERQRTPALTPSHRSKRLCELVTETFASSADFRRRAGQAANVEPGLLNGAIDPQAVGAVDADFLFDWKIIAEPGVSNEAGMLVLLWASNGAEPPGFGLP